MRNYVNKIEKIHLVYLAFFWAYLNDEAVKMHKSDLLSPPDSHNLKLATTWLKKFIFSLFDRLDPKSLKNIQSTVNSNSLELLPKREMEAKIRRVIDDKSKLTILTEAALYKCGCVCVGIQKDCELRKVFQEYDIPLADGFDGKCPYWQQVHRKPLKEAGA